METQLLAACQEIVKACEELKTNHPEDYGTPVKHLHESMVQLLISYNEIVKVT